MTRVADQAQPKGSETRRVLANSGWMIAEHVCKVIAGLYTSVLLARHLGPAGFGSLNFAAAYAALFAIAATVGLNRILVRELAKNQDDVMLSQRLLSTVLLLRCAAAILVYLLSLTLATLTAQPHLTLIAIVCASFLFSPADAIDLYFQSRAESRRPALIKISVLALVVGARTALVWAGAGLVEFAVMMVVETLLVSGGLLLLYRRWIGPRHDSWRFDRRCARGLLVESWPEIFAGLGAAAFARIDQVMLANLSGSGSVGVYSIAVRLSESWYFLATAMVASSFPLIVRLRETDPVDYLRRLEQLMRTLVLISYCAIVVAWLAGPIAIPFLFGSSFADSAPILTIHICSGLFITLGLASGSWLVAEGKTHLNLWRSIAGVIMNVGLNLVLIPRYGAIGAAYASLAAAATAYFLFDFVVDNNSPMARLKLRSLLVVRYGTARH